MPCWVSLTRRRRRTRTRARAGCPPSHQAPAQLCPFGVWGQPRASGWAASPVTSGSETAYSSQGLEREGRPFGQAGFLWGFPYQEPKAAAKAAPILTPRPVWRGGALPRRCPGAGTPWTTQEEGTQRGRGPGAGGRGEQGGSGLRHPGRVCTHGPRHLCRTHSGPREGPRAGALRPSPRWILKYFPPSRRARIGKYRGPQAPPRPAPAPVTRAR